MRHRRPPIRNRLLAALAVASAATAAGAAPRPAIVELYTSEGCSSCPPAEKVIEGLTDRADVLPLAFHVDYWDSLGWPDRFSLKEATQRQQTFAQTLKLATVGTPQFIVDGRTSVWGASPAALERALKAPRADVPLLVERKGAALLVRAPAEKVDEAYDVYVVGYLPKTTTAIHRGENAGRTLTEVNVVRYVRKVGQSRDAGRSWSVPLDSLPSDATRVVVLLQVPASGVIVGARTLELNEVRPTEQLSAN